MSFFNNLRWTHKAALFAFILGAGALLSGSPYKGSRVTLDVKELSLIVQNTSDHISVNELADWIITKRADYRLIDLRSDSEYVAYHIPGAENLNITDLTDAPFARNEKIVLYSEGGIHSAQAWMLLASRGFARSYMLFGGLEAWKDEILFPTLPVTPVPEQSDSLNRVKEVCAFFGGTVLSGATETSTANVKLPELKLPTGTSAAPAVTTKKKKKEGC